MNDAVLTLNSGSSSLKFAVFNRKDMNAAPVLRGEIEALHSHPHLRASNADGKVLLDRKLTAETTSGNAAIGHLIHWIESHIGAEHLVAAGHRIVHGGPSFAAPARLTTETIQELAALTPLAPLHQPACLAPVRVLSKLRPQLPQIACFDTAFHHSMPEVARRLPLPQRYDDAGIRRYGFHGLSYAHIASRLAEIAPQLAAGRVIVAHLGSGASLCAMRGGRSIETTMGFSALDGLVMGTRTGTLDPGVLLYMMQVEGLGWHEISEILYHQAGLLGVSGQSADMRELRAAETPAARTALALFTYRIVQEIGALAAVLGGIDGLVFTAGIGEHDAVLREEVCSALGWLGIALDPASNHANAPVISTPDSRICVRVEPADEECMICRGTIERLNDNLQEA